MGVGYSLKRLPKRLADEFTEVSSLAGVELCWLSLLRMTSRGIHVANVFYAATQDIQGSQNLGASIQCKHKLDALG